MLAILFLFPVTVFFLLLATADADAAANGCDGSGNCYIHAGATGSGNGSSWTNAYTTVPSSLTAGVTYWIANGNYGGGNFSSSGTSGNPITIMGATTSSHGPDATWNSSYAGQAVFAESNVSGNYITFNGQTRGSDWQSGYTIKFWNQTDAGGSAVNLTGSNITFQYVEMCGTGQYMSGTTLVSWPNNTATSDRCSTDNCGSWADDAIFTAGASVSNLYVGYCYVHHTGNTQFQMNGGVQNNVTWEYNWISYNHTGMNGQHDEAYSLYASNVIIRYNVFQDISGSGIITTAGAGQPAISNWDIYGNIFFWDANYVSLANGGLYNYWIGTLDNAILDFLGEQMSGYVHFYNNTVAGIYTTVADMSGTAFSTMPISGLAGSGGSTCGSSCPTVMIENNLWYGCAYVYGDYSSYCSVVNCASGSTQDYNTSYQGNVPSGDNWQTNSPAGPDDANNSSGNPFASLTANTIAGFALSSDTTAGITLLSPYDVDMLGTVRGSNGTWDRGALQIPPVSSPASPTIWWRHPWERQRRRGRDENGWFDNNSPECIPFQPQSGR